MWKINITLICEKCGKSTPAYFSEEELLSHAIVDCMASGRAKSKDIDSLSNNWDFICGYCDHEHKTGFEPLISNNCVLRYKKTANCRDIMSKT